MGPTGIGKSSVRICAFVYRNRRCSLYKQFIDRLTGDKGIKVGHGLGSQKPKIGVRASLGPTAAVLHFGDTPVLKIPVE